MKRCNICGAILPLSDEHIPPKSCGNKRKMVVYELFPELAEISNIKKRKRFIKQNGVSFKSICEGCNNARLGACFDKAFADFYNKSLLVAQSSSNFSCEIHDIATKEVVKCIFGKFLAMDSDYNGSAMCEEMRNFIINDIAPASMHLYVRYYPYDSIYIARNHGVLPTEQSSYLSECLISVLYYKPLAFVLSDVQVDWKMSDLIDMVKDGKTDLLFTSNSAYNPNTNTILPKDWLLVPHDDSYVVFTTGNATHLYVDRI